jgi:ATP-dependent Lon protease
MGSSSVVELPLLPLRDVVVYPHMVLPLFVGREKSIQALEDAMANDKQVLLVAQRNAAEDDPSVDDIYQVGTVSNILQLLKLPDGTIKVLVEGCYRAVVDSMNDEGSFTVAGVREVESEEIPEDEAEGLQRSTIAQFEKYVNLSKKVPTEVLTSLTGIDEKQMEKSQREYYLNEQMKAIQKELGDMDEAPNELDELQLRIDEAKMPAEARDKALSELGKLKMMSPMSAEASVVRSYIDWMVNVPWSKRSKVKHDLTRAMTILDEDHYGLDEVKERILEYLAVQKRVRKVKGPVLCLVGPPGVGKTSLGESLARATNRKFVRMALGGVRDEAEIRGHRRTYIGSMPGKLLQKMSKAGVKNPLFLLDEIDKMGMDHRGDPASAMLEVLDPEQNHAFNDHYLEVDYDLSDVMFVCTSNTMNIPGPLLDRLEVIRIPGYTEDEKLNIAERYLVPKQLKVNGLKKNEISISEDAVIDVIRYYTREAGVRGLEREMAKICRKMVKAFALGEHEGDTEVNAEMLPDLLGVRKFNYGIAEEENKIGQVTGLAWTSVGGELLTIEAVAVAGKGRHVKTGSLGDVMQESIQAANTVVRSRSQMLGIPANFHENHDVHIHVPEGATPKDGPSAGVAMCTALVSVWTSIPVRADVAMTGEITLRGEVLPIGGLKEKLLAARRGGIKTVIIPKENERDLTEIPENIKEQLDIKAVKWIDEVLAIALESMPKPLSDEEFLAGSIGSSSESDQDEKNRINTH